MIPRQPLNGMRERTLCEFPPIPLSVCVYYEKKRKVMFITEPMPCRDQSRAVLGLLDVENNALSSILTEWHQSTPVTSSALCKQGLLSCGQNHIVLVNFFNGKYEILVRTTKREADYRFMGVAVHPNESINQIWFTRVDPVNLSTSKIYKLDRKVEEVARTDTHKPVRIAFSPDGQRFYFACSAKKALFVYEVKNGDLVNLERLSYVPAENLTSLKVDHLGYIFASCGSELKCWDPYGNFNDVMQMESDIRDFTFTPTGIIVMYQYSWVKIEQDPEALTIRKTAERRHSHLEGRFSRI